MRLYLIDRTPLSSLPSIYSPPAAGDVVLYFRHGVDPLGEEGESLRSRGVEVIWAESLLSNDDDEGIDGFIDRFSEMWYPDQRDPERIDSCFSQIIFNNAISRFYFNFIVRDGEIFRKCLERWPAPSAVISDLRDGVAQFVNVSSIPGAMPRAALLHDVLCDVGIPLVRLDPEQAVPSAWPLLKGNFRIGAWIKSLVGGLRLHWLSARIRGGWKPVNSGTEKRVYLFYAQGFDAISSAFAKRGDVKVFGDRTSVCGMIPLRFDHVLALPGMALLRAARRVFGYIERRRRDGWESELVTYRGYDYGRYFADALRQTAPATLFTSVLKFAQMRVFLARNQFDTIVINGEGSPAARAVIHYGPAFGARVVFIDHSYYMHPFGYFPQSRNHRHVIYVAQGTDYVDTYGRHLAEHEKPWRPVVTNPCVSVMDGVRGNRSSRPGKRVMFTNYAPAPVSSVNRGRYCDRYFIDILISARRLLEQGCEVLYRPHPGIRNREYENFMIEAMGLAGKIKISSQRLFSDAIVDSDVVVTNCSGACYQSLYAGWPTIFYEPDFAPQKFVGLPAATDIDSPIASSPDELTKMIQASFNQSTSTVSTFPERFSTTLAERFIGRDADQCGDRIAEFLTRLCFDQEAIQSGKIAGYATSPSLPDRPDI